MSVSPVELLLTLTSQSEIKNPTHRTLLWNVPAEMFSHTFPAVKRTSPKKSPIYFLWSVHFSTNVCVCVVSKDADTSLIFSFEFIPSSEDISVFLPSQTHI